MDVDWDHIEAEQTWCYVHAGVAGVTAFVLFVFGLVSLCAVRRRRDPGRVAFTWLKFIFAFEIPGLVLVAASDFALSQSAFLAYNYGDRGNLDPDNPNDTANRNTIMLAYDVYSRTASVASLLRRIAQVLLTITIVEVGNGLLFALKRRRSISEKILRWLAMSIGFVLITLAAAHTGMANTTMRDQWYAIFDYHAASTASLSPDDISDVQSLISQGEPSRHLDGAYNILNFIVSIGILVYTSVVMHHYARVEPSRVCAIDLLVAALLNFARWTWFLVVSALWVLPDDGPVVVSTMGVTYGANAFLDIVDFAIVVIILFSISVLKKKGLWTTIQPWMEGVPPVMVVRPYPVYGQPHPPGPVGYFPNGHTQQDYSSPIQQQMPPGWSSPGPQQHYVQYVYRPPQEVGEGARYEISPEGIIELGEDGRREETAATKA